MKRNTNLSFGIWPGASAAPRICFGTIMRTARISDLRGEHQTEAFFQQLRVGSFLRNDSGNSTIVTIERPGLVFCGPFIYGHIFALHAHSGSCPPEP